MEENNKYVSIFTEETVKLEKQFAQIQAEVNALKSKAQEILQVAQLKTEELMRLQGEHRQLQKMIERFTSKEDPLDSMIKEAIKYEPSRNIKKPTKVHTDSPTP